MTIGGVAPYGFWGWPIPRGIAIVTLGILHYGDCDPGLSVLANLYECYDDRNGSAILRVWLM